MKCPSCGRFIPLTYRGHEFLTPPAWEFWGKAGARWKVCEFLTGTHFRVQLDSGKMSHRLFVKELENDDSERVYNMALLSDVQKVRASGRGNDRRSTDNDVLPLWRKRRDERARGMDTGEGGGRK